MVRSCGSCSLCCYVFNIDDIPKPINTWCPHCILQKVGSCGIYEDRPKPCIDFRCIWLQAGDPEHAKGDIAETYSMDLRPDKVGALIDVTENGEIMLVRVKKYKEFNKLKKKFRNLCYAIGQNAPLLLVDGDGSYHGVGLAIVDYFSKSGYNMENFLTASMGRDTYDLETEEGKRAFMDRLEASKYPIPKNAPRIDK